MLTKNTHRLWNTPEFVSLIQEHETASLDPTKSSKFRWFSSKVAKAIWYCKSLTFISSDLRRELDFLVQIFENPAIYQWESPIAHLIPREPDYIGWQDACLTGGGGFSLTL